MDWRVTAPPCKQVFSWRRNESHFTLGILLGILQRPQKIFRLLYSNFRRFLSFQEAASPDTGKRARAIYDYQAGKWPEIHWFRS